MKFTSMKMSKCHLCQKKHKHVKYIRKRMVHLFTATVDRVLLRACLWFLLIFKNDLYLGGLSFPNFRLYAQAFSLCPYQFGLILTLLCLGEQLRNLLFICINWSILFFSGVPLRQCKSWFGPIVTHLLSTWRMLKDVHS